MTANRKRLNLEIVESDPEAIEELETIRNRASSGELNEADLQVGLSHAYHHLNYAWNIRHVPTLKCAKLTKSQFNRWGQVSIENRNILAVRSIGFSTARSTMEACQGSPSRCRFPNPPEPKQRFRDTLTALLAVKKSDLRKIETALEAVRNGRERRKNRSIDK